MNKTVRGAVSGWVMAGVCLWTFQVGATEAWPTEESWAQNGLGPDRVPTRFVALEVTRDADFTGRLVTNAPAEAGVGSARVSVLYRLPGNQFFLCETTTDETGSFLCRGSYFVGAVDARFLYSGNTSFSGTATSMHWDTEKPSP